MNLELIINYTVFGLMIILSWEFAQFLLNHYRSDSGIEEKKETKKDVR